MSRVAPMKISVAALAGWVLPLALLTAGVGAYPTWAFAGADGLWAMFAAAANVLTVKFAFAAVVVRSAARGPERVAILYVTLALVRVIVSLALAAGAWAVFDLPPKVLLIWTAGFYVSLLAGEGAWLARALNRDAFRVALGEIDRRERCSGRAGSPATTNCTNEDK